MAVKVVAEGPDQPPTDNPATVAEAVTLAVAYCRHLDIFPSAHASAAQSRYPNPEGVWRKLELLNWSAERMASGALTEATLIGALKARDLDVSTESADTMRRYPETRQFPDEDGQLVEMQMHAKLGGGSGGDNRCRIHFHWEPSTGKMQVGHVGRHLPTSQS